MAKQDRTGRPQAVGPQMRGAGHTMRSMAIVGDSISTFTGCNPAGWAVYYEGERAARAGLRSPEDTWWHLAAQRLGYEVIVNASFSGSMVAGSGFPAASSRPRAHGLLSAGEEPQVILFFIGVNDYGWGSARAQAAARSSAAPTDACEVAEGIAGMAPDDALAQFAEAYHTMLANVRGACPHAELRCCTIPAGRLEGQRASTFASNLRGVTFDAYNDAIRTTARRFAREADGRCAIVDLAACRLDYEAVDGTHPTRLGMRQIAEMVAASWEGSVPSKELLACGGSFAPRGAVLSWETADTCKEGPCVGCTWARDTSNTWSCVCTRNLA